jgi:D-alanine-D-alanine ligase
MAKGPKIRIGIVFGGRSGEHEISIKSAASVIAALPRGEFEITAIGITKTGKFAGIAEMESMLPPGLMSRVHHRPLLEAHGASLTVSSGRIARTIHSRKPPQIIFPLLHGPYGEDGTIQGLMELAGLPYVGCGVLASAVGMDKDVMKRLFIQAKLPVAPFRTVFSRDLKNGIRSLRKSLEKELGYPMFSKPANLGSSVGICKIHDGKEFEDAVLHSAQFDSKVVIEKGIDARELECAILGNEDPQASVVGEVFPAHEFYDYDAKYNNADSRLEIPARIEKRKSEEIRSLAIQSFKAIGGSGLARVDFFLERRTGKTWINEINTMPGFTPISMYTKLWQASGIPFEQLVRNLVRLGLERFEEQKSRRISMN